MALKVKVESVEPIEARLCRDRLTVGAVGGKIKKRGTRSRSCLRRAFGDSSARRTELAVSHRSLNLTLAIRLLEDFSLVVKFSPSTKTQQNFGPPLLEVHLQGNQR